MKKNIKIYIISTYLLFFSSICLIGITMLFTKNSIIITSMQIASAWTPTIVFLLMFNRIYPLDTRIEYIRRQFSERISLKTALLAFVIPLLIFVCSVGFLALYNSVSFDSILVLSPTSILMLLPYHLVSGPIGEELGWRSFLLKETEKKYSTLKSGLLVGVVWGFWHFPLWLISGYTGMELLQYIIYFLIAIICCSIIITILYKKSRNLIIPCIMHLLNNFLISLFVFNLIDSLRIFALFYLIATFFLIIRENKFNHRENINDSKS